MNKQRFTGHQRTDVAVQRFLWRAVSSKQFPVEPIAAGGDNNVRQNELQFALTKFLFGVTSSSARLTFLSGIFSAITLVSVETASSVLAYRLLKAVPGARILLDQGQRGCHGS
jgi:hypothetical protein